MSNKFANAISFLILISITVQAQNKNEFFKATISFITTDSINVGLQYINKNDPLNFRNIAFDKIHYSSNNRSTISFKKTYVTTQNLRLRFIIRGLKNEIMINSISIELPGKVVKWNKNEIVNDYTITNAHYSIDKIIKSSNLVISPMEEGAITLRMSNIIEFNTIKNTSYLLLKIKSRNNQLFSLQYSNRLNKKGKAYPFNNLRVVKAIVPASKDYINYRIPLPDNFDTKAIRVNYQINSYNNVNIEYIKFYQGNRTATWEADKILNSFYYNQSVKQEIANKTKSVQLSESGYLELTSPIQWDLTLYEKLHVVLSNLAMLVLASFLLFLLNNGLFFSNKLPFK